jgi:ubiquinone/menaquinone biosynthesis C-methylase UbiE
MQTTDRMPHAVLDLPSRRLKALKIERLLSLSERRQPFRLLEIGTGSGGIAHYFANHQSIVCNVTAVDVVDERLLRDGYKFSIVEGTQLPFAEDSFDVVLSNHVIEHVGNSAAQYHHLCEISRVMNAEGVGYLAVPNRWMLIEPHYKLVFLSWLPRSMRSTYLRLVRRACFYDCEPLSLNELEQLLSKAGFEYRNYCTKALKETLSIEKYPSIISNAVGEIPNWIFDQFSFINPTLIYLLRLKP